MAETRKKTVELVIEAKRTSRHYWWDIWHYRELFFVLSWRDISVRYKQTVIGITWAVLRPLLTMVVFTIVFGKIAKLPTEADAPYALMVFSAILPWQLFSSSLTESSNSLTGSANLITKVYFPRLIIPASKLVTCFIDFLISSSILVLLMIYYSFLPGLYIFLIPVFLFIEFFAALGMGLFLTSMNVKYRDFRIIVPFIVQFGLYISPVGFSSSIIPPEHKFIYSINPMVGVIDGFRWAIIGGDTTFPKDSFILSLIMSLILFIGGIIFFLRMEKSFADII